MPMCVCVCVCVCVCTALASFQRLAMIMRTFAPKRVQDACDVGRCIVPMHNIMVEGMPQRWAPP